MAKISVQENEIAILTILGKVYNSNFNYGEFAVIESQKVLNKIAISQMRILSGGDVRELKNKGSEYND
jgi:hypothetical protein